MQMSFREIMTALHGMGFGGLLLLAFSGAFVELYRTRSADLVPAKNQPNTFARCYLIFMAVLAWATVFTGAYTVYPWYRAHPPQGLTDLSEYARASLLANPDTQGWHSLGMEWKEHVAWFVPIALTMVAYVYFKYGAAFSRHLQIRKAAFSFTLVAFIAAAIASGLGALINKKAPIQGGRMIRLMEGSK